MSSPLLWGLFAVLLVNSAARARTPQQTACTAYNDLLDHLVGEREDGWRHLQAERISGLAVHGELKFGRVLDRQ